MALGGLGDARQPLPRLLGRHGPPVNRVCADDVADQHAVLADKRSSRLGDDGWMIHLRLVAAAHDAIDHRVGVFLQAVVGREFAVRLTPVVVDAESAADIDELHPGAEPAELDVDPGQLGEPGVDDLDVADLASHVAVEHHQAVEHPDFLEPLDHLQNTGNAEPELGLLSRRVPPSATAVAFELEADADQGPGARILEDPNQRVELVQVFDHRDDAPPELGGEHHVPEIAFLLEPVAHDESVRTVGGHPHDREQFGFGSHLEPEIQLAADGLDFFDEEPLLVDLDGVDAGVITFVVVALDGIAEGADHLLDPSAEKIRETDGHRASDSPFLEALDNLEEIDLMTGPVVRLNHQVARFSGHEKALAPVFETIKIGGVLNRPDWFFDSRRRGISRGCGRFIET